MIRTSIHTETFTFSFNGHPVSAHPGDTIAAALLASGIHTTRTTASGRPRGPFCMMGACYDCLIELGGVTRQSCMTMAAPGLEVVSAKAMSNADQTAGKYN